MSSDEDYYEHYHFKDEQYKLQSNLVFLYLSYMDYNTICCLVVGCVAPYLHDHSYSHYFITWSWSAFIVTSPHFIIARNQFICVYI